MAKELYDGIYSSQKLVFIERIERNLKFYLKDKLIEVKIINQELFCIVEKEDLKEVLGELKNNPELQTEILNSINFYQSRGSYCILINLSSVSNNYSIILKVLLHSGTYGPAHQDYERIITMMKDIYESAKFYSTDPDFKKEYHDIRIINQVPEGMDCFDTYINTYDDKIEKIYFDTKISRVIGDDFYKGLKFTDLIVYLSRFDYNAGIFPEICYCLAIEQLIQLKIPKRVQYIRMLMSELFRISSHLYFFIKINKILGNDFAYNRALIERERILRILELITGARIVPNFIRIGGVKKDLDNDLIINIRNKLKVIIKKVNQLEALMLDNAVITSRLKELGIAERDSAIECGATGPNLRALGIRYDLRKNRNLLLYKDLSFLIPTGRYGDCLDRINIRFREIYQSIRLINYITNEMPDEHVKKLLNLRDMEIPFSEMISSIECPHGVFKIFMEVGGSKILNMTIMGPSRNNLRLAGRALLGEKFEDLELILASFDISCGEILQK